MNINYTHDVTFTYTKKACKKVQGYLKYFLSKPNIIKGITLALILKF